MSRYDHLHRDALIRLLQRRDAERQLGLVWERDEHSGGELEADRALNDDYVALGLTRAERDGVAADVQTRIDELRAKYGFAA